MTCQGCKKETISTPWGDWCDDCGGVVERTSQGTRLFFRHVATVDGPGGRFPIVYDLSAQQYGLAWPKQVTMVQCRHCGQRTPGDDSRFGLAKLEDGPGHSAYYSTRGTLDQVLALAQPHARGGTEDLPLISAAPSATDQERKQVLGE